MKSRVTCILILIAISSVSAARPEPQAQIDTFLRTLSEKGASAAIEGLCKGTLFDSQKHSELMASVAQFDAILKTYGKVGRVENVEKKTFGQSFLRFRVISYQESGAPLFWEFMFFKMKDEWQIYVFRVNDQIYKVFTDSL